jgi:ATP sulfurylase
MEGFYDPFGALIGSFNTYSRYSGPKEAVFTAICRKNYGCNYFIVGRDHTGVGNYYASDASQTIFDELDVGMKILKFDKVSYCPERKKITENNFNKNIYEISGTKVRDMIINEIEIPDYLLDPIIAKTINKLYLKDKTAVFEK